MLRWMDAVARGLLPPICIICRDAAGAVANLCDRCERSLTKLGPACMRCADPLPADGICPSCSRRPPAYRRVYAPFAYTPPISNLIHLMKFRGQLAAAYTLGSLLSRALERTADESEGRPDLLIPVPLHRTRLQERGFNQALEIARPIARRLEVPLVRTALRRTRATLPQAELDARSRRQNVGSAFEVVHALASRRVAVVDDVVTTGSTAHEVARVLKRAGVRQVDIWVCARARLNGGHAGSERSGPS